MTATKIAIIGTGSVGSTTAYACMMRNIASEIMLVDIDAASCKGQMLDLSDALSFSSTAKIDVASFEQAAQADIIIITAGKAQLQGQTREDLLTINKNVVKSVIEQLGAIKNTAVIILATNPVDIMTLYTQKLVNLPACQVIGSGTMLDSQRLRNFIAQKVNIAEQSIHVYIIGEHGDTQVAALSSASIAGVPIKQLISIDQLQQFATQTIKKAYNIIELKGYTCYGVAACIAAMCEDIIFDNNRIMPVSCYIKEYGICMSMPAAIGASGIKQIIKPLLNPQEESDLLLSVKSLQAKINMLK